MTQEELEALSLKCILQKLAEKLAELMDVAMQLLECLCGDCPPEEGEGINSFNLPAERNAGAVELDGEVVGEVAAEYTNEALLEQVKRGDESAVLEGAVLKTSAASVRVAGVELVRAAKKGA